MYKTVTGVIIGTLSAVALIAYFSMKKSNKPKQKPLVIQVEELPLLSVSNEFKLSSVLLPSELSNSSELSSSLELSSELSSSSDVEEHITYQPNNIGQLYRVRTGLYNAIRYNMTRVKMASVIGCTIPEFITYIEDQFTDGMSWENYGTEWHINNIIHHKYYNLEDPKEYNCCFNYKNLKPTWITDIGDKPTITIELFNEHKSRLCESVRYRLEVMLWW
jgi:hypothetical protein